jgi:hypothetical protein
VLGMCRPIVGDSDRSSSKIVNSSSRINALVVVVVVVVVVAVIGMKMETSVCFPQSHELSMVEVVDDEMKDFDW